MYRLGRHLSKEDAEERQSHRLINNVEKSHRQSEERLSVDWSNCTKQRVHSRMWRRNSHSHQSASLTGVHDQISSDLGLPVIPRRLKALGKADAEVLEVAFAHEGLGWAGGDQRALNGQDQSGARIKVYGMVGLRMWREGKKGGQVGGVSQGSSWCHEIKRTQDPNPNAFEKATR